MKQALQLKLGQQLALTPQLQQAIKLLQLSTLDLQQAISETIESNALLEKEEDIQETDIKAQSEQQSDVDFSDISQSTNTSEELPVDALWEDLLPSSAPPPITKESYLDYEDRDTEIESLHSHLMWQLNLTRFSAVDESIALTLIDSVDSDGRLTMPPEQIHAELNLEGVELEEVIAVLHRLQHFEPTGIFAVDLRECLLIQLRQLPSDTPHRELAGALVSRYLSQLPVALPRQLAKKMKTTEKKLKQAMQLIRSLDPTPGASIGQGTTEYITPDVFVRLKDQGWQVELNPDIAPRLHVNEQYVSLLNNGSQAERGYVKEHLQEARWFIKSLQSRNETLLKVATKIIEHQRTFLEQGEIGMKPLVLADIAAEVELHESTVSRATTRKYMHTPRGTFELKYFFSSRISTDFGQDSSSTAIKAKIKQLINEESSLKPLSDSKLCELLNAEGMNVARRTIAKYREQLSISPSNERKRLN